MAMMMTRSPGQVYFAIAGCGGERGKVCPSVSHPPPARFQILALHGSQIGDGRPFSSPFSPENNKQKKPTCGGFCPSEGDVQDGWPVLGKKGHFALHGGSPCGYRPPGFWICFCCSSWAPAGAGVGKRSANAFYLPFSWESDSAAVSLCFARRRRSAYPSTWSEAIIGLPELVLRRLLAAGGLCARTSPRLGGEGCRRQYAILFGILYSARSWERGVQVPAWVQGTYRHASGPARLCNPLAVIQHAGLGSSTRDGRGMRPCGSTSVLTLTTASPSTAAQEASPASPWQPPGRGTPSADITACTFPVLVTTDPAYGVFCRALCRVALPSNSYVGLLDDTAGMHLVYNYYCVHWCSVPLVHGTLYLGSTQWNPVAAETRLLVYGPCSNASSPVRSQRGTAVGWGSPMPVLAQAGAGCLRGQIRLCLSLHSPFAFSPKVNSRNEVSRLPERHCGSMPPTCESSVVDVCLLMLCMCFPEMLLGSRSFCGNERSRSTQTFFLSSL
jgi:hypothetical protein